MNVVFVAVVLLIAGWGFAMALRDRGPSSLADVAAAIIGVAVGGMLVAGLFGNDVVGPLPTAITVFGGLVLLLAVRGASQPAAPANRR